MGLKWIGGFPVITPSDDEPRQPEAPLPPLLIAAIIAFLLLVGAVAGYMVLYPHPHK